MTTKNAGSDFDDLQDILAGLLGDDSPTVVETPPDIEAEEEMETEAAAPPPSKRPTKPAPKPMAKPKAITQHVGMGAVVQVCNNAWHEHPLPGTKCLTCGATQTGAVAATKIKQPSLDDDDADPLAALQRVMDDDPEARVDMTDDPEPEFAGEGRAALTEALAGIKNQMSDEPELDDEALLRGLMDEAQGPLSQAQDEESGTAAEAELELDGEAPSSSQAVQINIPTFTSDEIADAIDIRNFGTLVTLQTRRWHAKVKDRQASKDAASASGADSEAFDTSKRLLVGADEKLKRIHKAIDTARAKHYDMTLPWSTVSAADSGKRTGARLLPNTLFMEYTTAMAHAKQEMKQALADFLPAYPGLVKIAQQRLGTRFNLAEYPHSSSIGQYFDLSFDFMPIPLGDDFKGLARAQVDKLADTLQRKNNEMLENAMQEAWLRLHEIVTHAHERLSKPDGLFHYTMVENLRSQAKLLKHLNVTGDQRIEDVRFFIEKHLTMHDVDAIRKDDALRRTLAKHAKAALEMMEEASP